MRAFYESDAEWSYSAGRIPAAEGVPRRLAFEIAEEETGMPLPERSTGKSAGSEKTVHHQVSRPKRRLSAPTRTVLLSILYIFWHFGNFFLIEMGRGTLFTISFVFMIIIYGITVVTRWYRTIPLIVLSVLIQNIGQLMLFPTLKNIMDGEMTHWLSLVYAGYHLISAPAMAALSFGLFTLIKKIILYFDENHK